MMAKITKRKALEKCIELWTLLSEMDVAKNPLRAKEEAAIAAGCGDYESSCPCCEYALQNGVSCESCPIAWGGYKADCAYCESDGAEWGEWAYEAHTPEERKQLALAIVKKAEEALAELPKRKAKKI